MSELRILVTKSLHGESAFDDFERLGTIVIQPKRLRGFDEFPASSIQTQLRHIESIQRPHTMPHEFAVDPDLFKMSTEMYAPGKIAGWVPCSGSSTCFYTSFTSSACGGTRVSAVRKSSSSQPAIISPRYSRLCRTTTCSSVLCQSTCSNLFRTTTRAWRSRQAF